LCNDSGGGDRSCDWSLCLEVEHDLVGGETPSDGSRKPSTSVLRSRSVERSRRSSQVSSPFAPCDPASPDCGTRELNCSSRTLLQPGSRISPSLSPWRKEDDKLAVLGCRFLVPTLACRTPATVTANMHPANRCRMQLTSPALLLSHAVSYPDDTSSSAPSH